VEFGLEEVLLLVVLLRGVWVAVVVVVAVEGEPTEGRGAVDMNDSSNDDGAPDYHWTVHVTIIMLHLIVA